MVHNNRQGKLSREKGPPAFSKDISSAFKAVQTKDKIPVVKIPSVLTTGERTEDLENKKSVTFA